MRLFLALAALAAAPLSAAQDANAIVQQEIQRARFIRRADEVVKGHSRLQIPVGKSGGRLRHRFDRSGDAFREQGG